MATKYYENRYYVHRKNLKDAFRRSNYHSFAHLEEDTDISQIILSQLFNGHNRTLTKQDLTALAKVLEVEFDTLFDSEEQAKHQRFNFDRTYVKSLLKRKGLTQVFLAETIGTRPSEISAAMRANRNGLLALDLLKISKLLKVPVTALVNREDEERLEQTIEVLEKRQDNDTRTQETQQPLVNDVRPCGESPLTFKADHSESSDFVGEVESLYDKAKRKVESVKAQIEALEESILAEQLFLQVYEDLLKREAKDVN